MRTLSIATLVLVIVGAACRAAPEAAGPAAGESPAAFSWAKSAPAEVGMDPAALAALDAEFKAGKYGYVDAMFVTRRGQVVADTHYVHDYKAIYAGRDPKPAMYNYYDTAWHPYYDGTPLHTMQSVSKSITSVIIGVARTRGQFPDLDANVLSFFPDRTIANLDARKQQMTIRHLLTMTAGFEWDESRTA